MTSKTIDIHIENTVATVYLNRPDVHNAFNPDLIEELRHGFEQLGQDEGVRVIVLTGKGKSFCAGADLSWMKSMAEYSFADNQADAMRMAAMFQVINICPKPVIGRINGAAIGGGMGLVSVCDVVIAVENAKFGFSEVKLGLTPAVISSFVIPKIGPGQARALFLTGERFKAERALHVGLVHYVVTPDELDTHVDKTVQECLAGAPGAIAEAKRMIHKLTPLELSTTLHMNAISIARRRASDEGQEGMAAFFDKRKPNWFIKSDTE